MDTWTYVRVIIYMTAKGLEPTTTQFVREYSPSQSKWLNVRLQCNIKIKILTLKLEHYFPIVLGLEVYFGWVGVGGHFLWLGGCEQGGCKDIFWVGGGGWTIFMGEWGWLGVDGGIFWVGRVEWAQSLVLV